MVDKPVSIVGPREALARLDCFDPAASTLDDLDPTRFAVVESPAPDIYADAADLRADDVRLTGLVLQGALGVEGNNVSAGVRTDGAYSGYHVDHNLIRHNGLGIDFGSNGTEGSRVDHNCLRDNDYGLASQTSDLIGARVDHNDLFRHGNAFEIGWVYHPTVDTSFDHNHTQAGGFWTYRLENTRRVTLTHNTVDASTSPFAIALYGGNITPVIVGNHISGPSGSGIQFLVPTSEVPTQSADAYVAANTVTAVGATPGTGIGIGVASTPDGTGALVGGIITHNRVSDGAGVGISIRPNSGLTVSRNVVERNGTYGIYARPGTTGVLFERNRMHDNGILDAIDEGTGNLWHRNSCVTDSPAGTICGTRIATSQMPYSTAMGHLVPVLSVLRLAVRDRLARPGRRRVPEPMVMDDAEGVRAFHESAPTVQMPTYEFNASMMSRLLPLDGTVLDLGSGSGQLAAHLAAGRPDVTITCVDLSEEMLDTGRAMAAARGLDRRLSFAAGDITALDDELVSSPDLVCCNWTLHQLPDRDTVIAALREIRRIREMHGSATWIFDFARLRRSETMPAMWDIVVPDGDRRLRVDAVASEAAAWTIEEMRDMLVEAGLAGLSCSRHRAGGLYQAWWASGQPRATTPAWERPSIQPDAAFWADRMHAAMSNLPTPP